MDKVEIPKPVVTQTESSLIRESKNKSQQISQNNTTEPEIIIRPQTFGAKLKDAFFVKEDLHSIGEYVLFDILIPNIRRSMFDAVVGTASQIFGQPIGRSRQENGYNGNDRYVDYTSRRRFESERQVRERQFTKRNISEIEMNSEEDAMRKYDTLSDIANGSPNQTATVHQFYEIMRIPSEQNPYTNNNFGWTAEEIDSQGSVRRNRSTGLYFISLPIARPLPDQRRN